MQTKETITLTTIFTTDKDKKTGQLLISAKSGKPYTKMLVKAVEFGDRWISGFQNAANKGWKGGDKVEILLEKKNSNGTEYLNFEVPKVEDKIKFEMTELTLKIGKMMWFIERIAEKVGVAMPNTGAAKPVAPLTDTIDYPADDINPEDIPF